MIEKAIRQKTGILYISKHNYNNEIVYISYGCQEIKINVSSIDKVIDALQQIKKQV